MFVEVEAKKDFAPVERHNIPLPRERCPYESSNSTNMSLLAEQGSVQVNGEATIHTPDPAHASQT